jgi:hypothetical protein
LLNFISCYFGIHSSFNIYEYLYIFYYLSSIKLRA